MLSSPVQRWPPVCPSQSLQRRQKTGGRLTREIKATHGGVQTAFWSLRPSPVATKETSPRQLSIQRAPVSTAYISTLDAKAGKKNSQKRLPQALSGICEGAFCSCQVGFILLVLVRLDKDLSASSHRAETLCRLFLWGFSQLSQTGKITTSHTGKTSTLGKAGWGVVGRQLRELLNFICVITVLCNTHSAIRYMNAFFLSSYLANLQ